MTEMPCNLEERERYLSLSELVCCRWKPSRIVWWGDGEIDRQQQL